jgi:UDP-N-acetyl-D-mannosaminuronic acid dehydrogenase
MPQYTVARLGEMIGEMENKKIGVLGISYKGNVNDIRGSPGLKIFDILKEHKTETYVFDPNVPEKSTTTTLNEILEKSDYLILATAHDEFKEINAEILKKHGIKGVVDGRNFWNKEEIKNAGIEYKGIGR